MIRKGEHTGTAQGCSKPVIHIPVYIENDDFLPELELIGFSTLVSANKANLKDIPSNIYKGAANIFCLVSGSWQNAGVFYIDEAISVSENTPSTE